jgi:multiple sugar transport system ATP-binding protein
VLHKRPGLLSGGERQRVAIGRALMRDAAGYLMDDPISALDARLREAMRVELKRLQRDIGHTLIYVTHDQEEAMAVADRMAILEAGSVRQLGQPQDVYESPNCRYVAALVGSPTMNFARGVSDGEFVRVAQIGWTVPVALRSVERGEAIDIGFRPESVTLREPGAGEGFDADVVSVEPLGASTVVVTDCGGLTFKVQAKGQLALSPGDRVRLSPSLERLVCFRAADGERLTAAPPSSVN